MEKEGNYKEERFDSYLNKTIILTSRTYFKKQMNTIKKERAIVDDTNYSTFLKDFMTFENVFFSIDEIDVSLQLKSAINSLSAIEQAVIFLLFEEELSQGETAEILKIYSKTVSKIKIRAIRKLKELMKGDIEDEK